MMNLPDRAALLRDKYGTETVEPGTAPAVEPQQFSKYDLPEYLKNERHDQFEPFIFAVANGTNVYQEVVNAPDYWYITVNNTAGIILRVYYGVNTRGTYFALGPTGKLKVPGTGHTAVCIENVGTAPALVNVVAMGKDVNYEHNFGNI